MTAQETYTSLIDLFKSLESHQSLSDLIAFIDELELKQEIKAFYNKYPKLGFNIEPDEIVKLKEQGILDDRNKLNTDAFNGTTLERLLAAALWKNGDINKLPHIVDGIIQADEFRSDYSLVFKQFGHSLANSFEPVVDQHVLRAFEIKSLPAYSENVVTSLRKKSIYKTSDKPLLDSYRQWFKNQVGRIHVGDQPDYKEKLDKILFLKGKAVKT